MATADLVCLCWDLLIMCMHGIACCHQRPPMLPRKVSCGHSVYALHFKKGGNFDVNMCSCISTGQVGVDQEICDQLLQTGAFQQMQLDTDEVVPCMPFFTNLCIYACCYELCYECCRQSTAWSCKCPSSCISCGKSSLLVYLT